jgi:hypothetical protein
MSLDSLYEVLNPHFNTLTFYKMAKNHTQELRRIMTNFFQKQGYSIVIHGNTVNLKDIGKHPKNTRDLIAANISNQTEIGKNFSGVTDDYQSRFEIPEFIVNGHFVTIKLKSNDTFFDTGHDITLSIRADNNNVTSDSFKRYYHKINLLKPVDTVLGDIVKCVNQDIEAYVSGVTQGDEPRNQNHYSPSAVQMAYDLFLRNFEGKDAAAGLPVEFKMITKEDVGKMTGSKSAGLRPFTISLESKTKKTASKSFLNKHPEINSIFAEYKQIEAVFNQVFGSTLRYAMDNVFPSEVYDDDSKKMIDSNFIFFCKKMANLGYRIKKSTSGTKQASFEFSRGLGTAEERFEKMKRVVASEMEPKFVGNIYHHSYLKFIPGIQLNKLISQRFNGNSLDMVDQFIAALMEKGIFPKLPSSHMHGIIQNILSSSY